MFLLLCPCTLHKCLNKKNYVHGFCYEHLHYQHYMLVTIILSMLPAVLIQLCLPKCWRNVIIRFCIYLKREHKFFSQLSLETKTCLLLFNMYANQSITSDGLTGTPAM